MKLLLACPLLAGIIIMLAAIVGFLRIRRQLQAELYGAWSRFNLLTVVYTTLMCFFVVAYAAFLVHVVTRVATDPIHYLLTALLFGGSVFVGLSVRVMGNSIDAVLGVKLDKVDTMTGLLTKRGFELATQRVLDSGAGDYALVIADMDRFKAINDTYGHKKGDEMILSTARIIRETVRASDTVGRFGGDEFVILLRNSNAAQAAGVMDRIERAVVRLQRDLGCDVRGGMSYGVATLRGGSGAAFADVLAEADRALYEMKAARRQA